MGRLIFTTSSHQSWRYAINGRTIPSVTGRIAAAGLLGPGAAFYTPESAARGTRVHSACTDLDLGRTCTLPPAEQGFLDSYTAWRTLMQPTWTSMEEPHYSAHYDTAGTADRIGTMAGTPLILDFKTGGPASWHGLQLAMYDLLHDDLPPQQRRRIALYLRIDGRLAQSVEYLDPADYTLALTLMKRMDPDGTDFPDRGHRGHVDVESQVQPGTVKPDHRARRPRQSRRRSQPRG